MLTFTQLHTILLKLAKIDINNEIVPLITTADPATQQFFKGVNLEGDLLKIYLGLSIKDSRLNNLDLNSEVIDLLEKKESYIEHIIDGEKNQIVFSFGFGTETDFVKKLQTYCPFGSIESKHNEGSLQVKKDFIATQKQDIINIESVLEEKKDYLEKTKKELKEMEAENEEVIDFKRELQKKGLL